MLKVAGLNINSGDRPIVKDVSFILPDQGITALIGPSGCGKSSVMKWLAGAMASGLKASGRLLIEGQEVHRPNAEICYQPQGDTLLPWLTVARNAALGLEISGISRADARGFVTPLFQSFGLCGYEDLYPKTLSGGMRQRVAFMRSIVQKRRYLLLDEPFSALDAVTRLTLQDWLLRQLGQHPRGVLLVTHDLYEASALADRIIVMAANPGRIIAEIENPLPHKERNDAALSTLRTTLKTLLLKDSK